MDEYLRHPSERKRPKTRPLSTEPAQKKGKIAWIITVTLGSFAISSMLTIASSEILREAEILTAFLVIIVIVAVNIVFDIIGTAVTAAEEAPFHAMASRKLYAAKQSIRLIRNAEKVSNVCNDVVGDICGIISGAAGTYIIFRIIGKHESITLTELVVTGLLTAFTVGGKALGKTIALNRSNNIIYNVGVITKFISDLFTRKKRKPGNGRKKRK